MSDEVWQRATTNRPEIDVLYRVDGRFVHWHFAKGAEWREFQPLPWVFDMPIADWVDTETPPTTFKLDNTDATFTPTGPRYDFDGAQPTTTDDNAGG